MKKYASMATDKLWYARAVCCTSIEDELYRALTSSAMANVSKIKRLKAKREMIESELRERGVLRL